VVSKDFVFPELSAIANIHPLCLRYQIHSIFYRDTKQINKYLRLIFLTNDKDSMFQNFISIPGTFCNKTL